MQTRTQRLIARLKAYVETGGRGTPARPSRNLGIGRNRIYQWLSGKLKPGLEHGLQLQELLKKQNRPRTKKPVNPAGRKNGRPGNTKAV